MAKRSRLGQKQCPGCGKWVKGTRTRVCPKCSHEFKGKPKKAPAPKPAKAVVEKPTRVGDTITIAQIETAQAIQNIDAIAAVPGIDALLIGPNDLAISMGCAGDFLGDTMDKAIGKVAAAAKTHGKIFGMHGSDGLTERWLSRGLTLVMSNQDASILTAGLKAICQKYKS